jgi:DNA-binding HxlR family transcriptional regulator
MQASEPPHDVYNTARPSRLLLQRAGDKWTVLLLGFLREQPRRFNELRRRVGGISQKMLSQTLKSLERDGLVRREVVATVPLAVAYSITPLGTTLANALEPLRQWAESHLSEVQAAQRLYDSALDARTVAAPLPGGIQIAD